MISMRHSRPVLAGLLILTVVLASACSTSGADSSSPQAQQPPEGDFPQGGGFPGGGVGGEQLDHRETFHFQGSVRGRALGFQSRLRRRARR